MSRARLERLLSEGKTREHISEDRLLELEHSYSESLSPEISAVKPFFLSNFFSIFIVMLSGLISLLYIPSILEVLDLTGNSSSPQKAFNRYLRTVNHTYAWFTSSSSFTKSLHSVRKAHLSADRSTRRSERKEGPFMTQFDMVITQWGFVGPIFTHPHKFGIKSPSKSGLEALRALMYKVGYFVGIEDEFNLCSGSLEMTESYATDIHERIIKPSINKGGPKSDQMTEVLLLGIHVINPFVFPPSFGKWCFEALDCHEKASSIHIPFLSGIRLIYWIQNFVIGTLMLSSFTRPVLLPILNFLIRLNIFLCNKLYPAINKMNHQLYA